MLASFCSDPDCSCLVAGFAAVAAVAGLASESRRSLAAVQQQAQQAGLARLHEGVAVAKAGESFHSGLQRVGDAVCCRASAADWLRACCVESSACRTAVFPCAPLAASISRVASHLIAAVTASNDSARQIWQAFLQVGSPFEVNLSDQMRSRLQVLFCALHFLLPIAPSLPRGGLRLGLGCLQFTASLHSGSARIRPRCAHPSNLFLLCLRFADEAGLAARAGAGADRQQRQRQQRQRRRQPAPFAVAVASRVANRGSGTNRDLFRLTLLCVRVPRSTAVCQLVTPASFVPFSAVARSRVIVPVSVSLCCVPCACRPRTRLPRPTRGQRPLRTAAPLLRFAHLLAPHATNAPVMGCSLTLLLVVVPCAAISGR